MGKGRLDTSLVNFYARTKAKKVANTLKWTASVDNGVDGKGCPPEYWDEEFSICRKFGANNAKVEVTFCDSAASITNPQKQLIVMTFGKDDITNEAIGKFYVNGKH